MTGETRSLFLICTASKYYYHAGKWRSITWFIFLSVVNKADYTKRHRRYPHGIIKPLSSGV